MLIGLGKKIPSRTFVLLSPVFGCINFGIGFDVASGAEMDIHIIDDDADVRLILTTMAARLGFLAKCFTGSADYLEFMDGGEYAPPKLAVLSDVEMPLMSGYELMHEVRKSYPDQRFIIITGRPSAVPVKEQACFYLTKPVSIGQLKMALEAQSQCVEFGPDAKCFGCAAIGDHRIFGINNWNCPLAKS